MTPVDDRPELQRYILHLNHALAMEAALVDHLEKRANSVPSSLVREKLLFHRNETIHHRDTLRELIESVDGEPTSTKANVQSPIAPGVVGKVMSALESEKEDRLLMEDLADFAVEQYEAAVYSGLILIAHNLGFVHHVARFEPIRQQERAMADFISSGQPAMIAEAFPPIPRAA